MTGSSLALVQPLHSLPSVLGMRDLRGAIVASRKISLGRASAEALLAVDPLSALRALRLASAPLWAPIRAPETVAEIVATLGSPAVLRLFDVPSIDLDRTSTVRTLWLHAVATACAARDLAETFGAADPDHAYLRGLLHDLDAWLEQLSRHHDGRRPEWGGEDLVRLWKLPLPAAPLTPCDHASDPISFVRLEPQALVEAASRLATVAGFPHPGESDEPTAIRDELAEAIVRVREGVAARLDAVGLELTKVGDPQSTDDDTPTPLFPGRPEPSLTELVARMLDCREAATYAAATTLGTAAALRFLDFDRAFVITWNPACRRVWVRGKADLTELGLVRRSARPTDRETDTLADTLTHGEPRVLVRGDPRDGLCGAIGADRALVVPLRGAQRLPSFLVVDRAPTTRALDTGLDGSHARVLSGFLSLLIENLELRLRRRRAERNATIDPLTGLANRGVGLLSLEQALAAAKREGDPLCVMMIDLDEFKQLNDTFGHLVGDHALRATSAVLRRTMRGADTVCRYGGEEFLVILPNTEAEDATILATRLFTAVGEAGKAHGLPVTCSIGLASLRPTDTLDDLVGRADGALYASKSRGRNRFSADTE